jgi:hypothetical protein
VAIVVLPEPPFGFRTRIRCMYLQAYAAPGTIARV